MASTVSILAIISFLASTLAGPTTIPSINEMIPLGPVNKDTGGPNYYVSPPHIMKSWNGAIAHCNALNMKLLYIETTVEDNEVMGLLSGVNQAWTSGNDLITAGDYIWQATGRGMVYTRWDFHNSPAPTLDYCGAIYIGGSSCSGDCNKNWAKDYPTSLKRFVCKL